MTTAGPSSRTPEKAGAGAKRPAIVVISSHVARGSVGIRSAAFALEVRGHPVWTVPTISLPFHPGHGPATKIIPDTEQFGSFLNDLLNSPWINEVGGVLTGYMANAEQVALVAAFISRLGRQNPELVYLCDPVIGDSGGLYVTQATATSIRDNLLPLADIATPNAFELAWLCGESPPLDLPQAAAMARKLASAATIVTSAPAFMRGNIASLYCDGRLSVSAEHRHIDGAPSGTGDLFSALFLSHVIEGVNPQTALQRSAASTFEVIAHAVRLQSDELLPEACISSLQRPMAIVSTRTLATGETEAK